LIALEPGESRKLQYALIINARYNADSLPLSMKIQEKFGRYAEDWKQSFKLHQQIAAPRELVVQASAVETKTFETASFKSDVDRDIPVSVKKNPNRYALVIGNEDYASRNANLSKSINVDYAQNDAEVFAEYLKSAFGIPIENIKPMINATSGEMRSGLSWIENNARAYGASVELYFFYSGHGLPTDADRSPHLIPVDISGERPEQGIALKEVYEKLTQHPAQKITVVLDACFSGGARNEELIARKVVRVQPKPGAIPGNMVVLTSSNGNQSSAVFREKKHGYLTYYLLKGIQSQGTETTYGKLFEYTAREVDIEASRRGILQQPQIQYGPDISDSWKSWSIE
jgi:uncharacterized caspase-like protein